MNRRGSILGYTAVSMAALVGIAGFAVDLQRMWLVQTPMKTALDAAALVAARDYDSANRDANARAVFRANLDPRGGTGSALGAAVGDPVVALEGADAVRVSATAEVPHTLFRVFSTEASTITDSSVARRAAAGLELAVVLDQTGSMSDTDAAAGTTKIEAAKAALRTMLAVLYGPNDTQRNLYVSVVPFARTINIGTANSAMLDTSSMPAGWSQAAWSGCVEARRNGEDITESSPATPQGRFRPYFWPSTYRQVGTYPANCSDSARAYASLNGTRWCRGDNDYSTASATIPQSHLDTNPHYRSLRDDGAPQPYFGPNTLCAQNSILPLTASKAAVLQHVNAITAPGRSGGTTVVTGMQGGWFTLSPDWRGWWPSTNPAGTPALPLDYNTRHMRKAVVLLSDGDNNWQGATSVYPSIRGNELFYNAYGRLADNRLPITPSTNYNTTASRADAALDTRWSTVCTAMKNRGIAVYVIGFGVASSAHRTLLRNCATAPDYYFESPTTSALQATFRQVANRLAGLRLAE